MVNDDDRFYCPFYPCLPRDEWNERAPLNRTRIRMSASFATIDAYYFHIEHAHFIARIHAPAPLTLTTKEEDRP